MALFNTTTKQEFKEKVLDSDKLVLVDFWAEWCPPCRAMAPTLNMLADSMDDKVDIVKVNIEDGNENGQIATEYGVQSIPNMNVFKGGEVVDQIVGMVPKMHLEGRLNQLADDA